MSEMDHHQNESLIEGSTKELAMLLKLSQYLNSTLEVPRVLQISIESITSLLGLDTGAIYTTKENHVYLGAAIPLLPADYPAEFRKAELRNHPHLEKSILGRKPVYVENAQVIPMSEEEQVIISTRHLVSLLYIPLFLKDTSIGCLIVGTTDEVRFFSEREIDLCTILAHQISLALHNASLYEQAQTALADLSRAYNATLEGWSHLLDIRDHITDEHTGRVTETTLTLAARFGFCDADLENIRRGALLHDIGKIGIPDHILQKPGPLTEDEFLIMQRHPELAFALMSRIDYLLPAINIPYCHHEKWDGTGYPRKLKGEEIPLEARIFAVVDVFDALTHERPYRCAWAEADALRYIQEQAGRQFAPKVVEVFLEMLQDEGRLEKTDLLYVKSQTIFNK
ncbi:MAG: HD domain-containing phosphohydrolase [Anaerolineales bacterium]|jgi:HD-GYP domain-containing protein (c-di-GMP phosphodiesterase class II)|nr:MAG: HD domain-containing phosphohydrolase [Anaerolineales bacterium]